MLLAQAANPPAIIHANSLYHEWGLVAAVLGICVAIIYGLWWLLKLDLNDTTASGLKIRSVLASMFQETIVKGAVRIFDLIDNHLPYALSQVDAANARPSAFDRLCEKMRDFGDIEENRDSLREALESTLSGVLIGEVRKLLQIAEITATGDPSTYPNPTGLRISLEGDTERRLAFIAQKSVMAKKKDKGVRRSRWFAFCAFVFASACGLLSSPWVFLDYQWAFLFAVTFLSLFAFFCIFGLFCLIWFYRCQAWIESTANRYNSSDDWFGEMSKYNI